LSQNNAVWTAHHEEPRHLTPTPFDIFEAEPERDKAQAEMLRWGEAAQ